MIPERALVRSNSPTAVDYLAARCQQLEAENARLCERMMEVEQDLRIAMNRMEALSERLALQEAGND